MVFQGDTFYHGLLRKYVVVFGNYFNNITIERTDENNNTVAVIKVPIQFSAKEKMIVRLNADPALDRPAAAILPILSFELLDPMTYDVTRKLDTMTKVVRRHPTDKDKFKVLYEPVPYNLHFNLYIYSKNQEDNNKILEQILPFFTPEWTASVELIPEMGIVRDIPLVLNNVTMQDIYDGQFKDRRVLIYTLSFTMLAYFYGPIRNKPMIKFTTLHLPIAGASTNDGDGSANTISSTNYMMTNTDANNAQDYIESITGQPGLDANGHYTVILADTVNYHLIDVNDDFGFITNKVDNLNGPN